jgi:hypothetical protein
MDSSLEDEVAFMDINVTAAIRLLQPVRTLWATKPKDWKIGFGFHRVSTLESLGATTRDSEARPFTPNSPYSTSKATRNHLVKSWNDIDGLPLTLKADNGEPMLFCGNAGKRAMIGLGRPASSRQDNKLAISAISVLANQKTTNAMRSKAAHESTKR